MNRIKKILVALVGFVALSFIITLGQIDNKKKEAQQARIEANKEKIKERKRIEQEERLKAERLRKEQEAKKKTLILKNLLVML